MSGTIRGIGATGITRASLRVGFHDVSGAACRVPARVYRARPDAAAANCLQALSAGGHALEREALGDGVGEVPIQAQARRADGVVIGFCSPVGKNQ
ncbi:hypothetical protein C0053_20270 [Pseudomonas aeruginosa]|nr:hypothetical protein C0053_20270 [Pseudomonas aeruginosa]